MNEVLHDKHSITPPTIVLDTSVTTSLTTELSTSTDELEETSAQTNNEELPGETVNEKEKSKDD